MKKEDWIMWIGKIGKDRFILLLLAGLILVLLSGSLPLGSDKEGKQMGQADMVQKTEEGENSAGSVQSAAKGAQAGSDMTLAEYERYYQTQLEAFLSRMYGAGSVRVLVFMQQSEERVYAQNCPYQRRTQEEKSGDGSKSVTEIENEAQLVFYEAGSGKKEPVELKRLAPKVGGVIVLSQGGDQKKVADEISKMLQALFGIDAHKIRVAKLRE